MQTSTQNEDQTLRDDIEIALASVANAHGVVVSVGEVHVQRPGCDSDTLTVATNDPRVTPEMLEAVMERFYEAREAKGKAHSKHKYHHRLLVAATVGVGIYVVYHVIHTDMVLKGFEYLIPAVVDKLIFGLGE
jgi:hypothetical protein